MNSLETGKNLEKTMYLAYMKNVSTAQIYAKRLSVLFPNHDWKKAGIDTSQEIDTVTLAMQMQGWRAFMSEGSSI